MLDYEICYNNQLNLAALWVSNSSIVTALRYFVCEENGANVYAYVGHGRWGSVEAFRRWICDCPERYTSGGLDVLSIYMTTVAPFSYIL